MYETNTGCNISESYLNLNISKHIVDSIAHINNQIFYEEEQENAEKKLILGNDYQQYFINPKSKEMAEPVDIEIIKPYPRTKKIYVLYKIPYHVRNYDQQRCILEYNFSADLIDEDFNKKKDMPEIFVEDMIEN